MSLTPAMRNALDGLRAGNRIERQENGIWREFYPDGTPRDFPPTHATILALKRRGLVYITMFGACELTEEGRAVK